MNLEDFDEDPAPPATREQIESEQTERILNYRLVRDLIISPEVAAALREGWSFTEIAEVLRVDKNTVAKHCRSQEMQVLIDRESRRIMRHMAGRKLKDVNYRDLTVSLGVMIDKARLLRNEPTEIVQHEEGTASRLAELFFRRRARAAGENSGAPVVELAPDRDGSGVLGLPEQSQQALQEPCGSDSPGSDEPAERTEP